jgi:Uma2 family endonuclease
MPVKRVNPILDLHFYEQAARDYCATLPMEHFMESTPQQAQRKITLSAFELIHTDRPDVWCYNELLIQHPMSDSRRDIIRVVPDNLVVLHDRPIVATGSFTTTVEQARLLVALEYVSESSKRKDYVENMERYEQIRMPHYLMFEPEKKLIILHRWSARAGRLVSVPANAAERFPIPKLELEVGLHDDWMRFWFRGELLPLPAELKETLDRTAKELQAKQRELATARQKLGAAEQKLGVAENQLSAAEAEIARLKAELAKRTPKS